MSVTSGPWRIERTPYGIQIHAGHACDIRHVAETGCDGELRRTDEEADAHLIAAAPDMLEALQSAVGLFDHTFAMGGTIHKQMKAAIAKATGA